MNKQAYYKFSIRDDNGESSWVPLSLEIQLNSQPDSQVASFQLFFAHISYLCNMKKDAYLFERHLLAFQTYDTEKMDLFFKTLIDQCYTTNYPLETLAEYTLNIRELFKWPNSPTPLPPVQYPIPTYSWLINTNQNNTCPPKEKFEEFDQQIIVAINWTDGVQNKSFRGYWHYVSTAFLMQKINSKDPYYRRNLLIAEAFKPQYIDAKLTELTNYLATIKQGEREDYLKHHFEYDGQTMFYEQ